MNSLQGHFLVASPHLADGNFNRSVVLIVKHDDEGAFGLVLNRPTASSVAEVWKVVANESIGGNESIYVGGPVTTALVALHTIKSAGEIAVLPGIFFSSDKNHLHQVVRSAGKPYRFFSGYSGWGSGQLEGELQAGGWLVASATAELVFARPDSLWDQIVGVIAQDILAPVVPTRHAPKNPGLN